MKKKNLIGGILLTCTFSLISSITVQANSLSATPRAGVNNEIPTEIIEYANIIGNEFNICPELLEAIAYQESSCKSDALNGSCKGLMQLNLHWHISRFKDAGWDPADWTDPYKNMYVAAEYLSELFDEYEDVAMVLYVYNGDSTNMKKYKENGYLSYYVSEILDTSEELERNHGK